MVDIVTAAAIVNCQNLAACVTTCAQTVYNCCYALACNATNDGAAYSSCAQAFSAQWGCNDYWRMAPHLACTYTCNTNYIPNFAGGTSSTAGTGVSGFKVCGTNVTTGAVCSWVVPSGISSIRIQLWGPGGHSGSGCCCGGSPFGDTGAYASLIFPAVAGCIFTLCAGCACCCNILWTSGPVSTCAPPSFATGGLLCNFCAQGGTTASVCTTMYDQDFLSAHGALGCDMGSSYMMQWNNNGYMRFQSLGCNHVSAGACACNSGSDYCFYSSCATCGVINFQPNSRVLFYGCYNAPYSSACIACTYALQARGLPGMHAYTYFDTNHYGFYCHPPIYGFETTSACGVCATSVSCGGALCDHNQTSPTYMVIPGAGGTFTHVMGGCTSMCSTNAPCTNCGGGLGRSGMVCVSYC